MMPPTIGPFSLDTMVQAVEAVRERLLRAARALETAGIAYAVVGGNAVALWVERAGQGGARNTPDVDLLIRRTDLDAATAVLEHAGFVRQPVAETAPFLDGPQATQRQMLRLVFAGERVLPQHVLPAPDVSESEAAPSFRVLTLEALARMKLTSHRLKDRVHLRDLLDVGLIDAAWCARFPPALAERLQHLIDTPEG